MQSAETTMTKQNINSEESIYKPWIVCLAAALFFFYEFIQMNMFNAISPQLMQTFHLNATKLGYLSSFYFYASLAFLFPAGQILDRVSTRKLILIAMIICVSGTFFFALSTSFYFSAFCRFLTGIGSAFCFLSCILLASRWFPSQKMALISGLIVTMAMIGGTIAQTPLTKLTELFGWRHALMIDAAFGVIIIVLVMSFVEDYPRSRTEYFTAGKRQLSEIGFWKSFKLAYLSPQNWLCGLYTCLMNSPIALLGALWGSLYLIQVHHFTPIQASNISAMIFIGTIIGSPTAGWISDKIGSRKRPMLVGAALTFGLMLLILTRHNPSYELMLMFYLGLGFISSTQIISYPMVSESVPSYLTASAVSVASFTVILGYAVLQPLFGALLDLHWNGLIVDKQPIYSPSDYHLAMLLLPIGFVISFICMLFTKETHCKPFEEK